MTTALDSATVAQYLAENPLFFQEHAGLLAQVQLSSPLMGRAVSLQERQMEVMREKYKALELRMAELLHMAQDNDAITHKLHLWTRALLLARNDVDLPYTLIDGLRTIFDVPQVTLRMWRVAPDYSHTWFVQDVSDDTRLFANGLVAPYCGTNNDFEAVRWLDGADQVRSTAILPLRVDGASDAFGLLILGSPDPQRFTAAMATDFLGHIGDTSSAALACLLD
ncbi:DUF484 family protein [Undibacterium arcticum]|uniref:DUF484 family protein n=1 Tax=Undibacterium arcticum TaxID=1762892 RepID=A0ABV7F1H0_9BURK